MTQSVGKKVSNTFVWILMALLVVGLMGFGTTQFNSGVQSVASVGDREVEVNDYARALDREINELGRQFGTTITLAQAEQFGITAQVLGQLMASTALDNETDMVGLSAGDDMVARDIQRIPSFQDLSGQFDAAVYRSTLDRSGLSVVQFESRMRDEIARNILQTGVAGGLQATDVAANAFLDFIATSRDFAYLTLDSSVLDAPIAAPADADLRSYFGEVGEAYVVPETKNLTYAWVTPEMLAETITIEEEQLRAVYAANSDKYNTPERRLVERLVFSNETAANDAVARLADGSISFEALVEERGLALGDVDLGDVTRDDLGDAADAVFAVTETGSTTLGPTTLGPAIFRVNAILYAQETSFEDVRDDLNREEAIEEARRVISDLIGEADDLLAGGATLEDLAQETDMTLATIGYNAENNEGIAAYGDFRAIANQVVEGDFPAIETLDDGGIFALRLDRTDAERPQTFDEAREALTTAWTTDKTAAALEIKAAALIETWKGGALGGDLGVPFARESKATRQSPPTGIPGEIYAAVLEMNVGDYETVVVGDTAYVIQLAEINAPDISDPVVADQRQTVLNELAQGIAQDLFSMYTNELQRVAGISLNQAAIAAVHAQFP